MTYSTASGKLHIRFPTPSSMLKGMSFFVQYVRDIAGISLSVSVGPGSTEATVFLGEDLLLIELEEWCDALFRCMGIDTFAQLAWTGTLFVDGEARSPVPNSFTRLFDQPIKRM